MAKPIVTIIRPELTPEEREKRLEEVKRCMRDFWAAIERRKAEVQNDTPALDAV